MYGLFTFAQQREEDFPSIKSLGAQHFQKASFRLPETGMIMDSEQGY